MELRLDFATSDENTGFRLEHFELYNWGTYDKKIVKLKLSKNNALLTGEIGSGKSTIVDAITSLLVPHQKITYNKAAGANTKERTLYSYIVGEYKSTQDENFGHQKAISLRDESSFSVLLGRFENTGYKESLTLAQFFYISQKKVHKFFVISRGDLSIKNNFLPKFKDIKELKKRLRSLNHTEVFDNFSEYFKSYSRLMGIKNEQAMNLFYQTVSLKSIGNLTEFIRVHMLENSKIDEKVDEICLNFATLNHTHDLVLEAKEQIELLKPIKKSFEKYEQNSSNHSLHVKMRDSLDRYFSVFESELLEKKLKELGIEKTKNISKKELFKKGVDELSEDIFNIKLELQKNGADRINKIEDEIKHLVYSLEDAKKENANYNSLLKKLDFKAVSNEHRFLVTKDEIKKQYEMIDEKRTKYQNQINIDMLSFQNYEEKLKDLNEEIVYLQNNPSNIPHKVSKIRDEMAKVLNLEVEDLPFIGELVRVKDKNWSGAIERVLHATALSLLVEKRYYEAVSTYVENTNLRGKLIYLKVDTSKKPSLHSQTSLNSLLGKIEVKVDSDYFEVVHQMLHERFDIPCVENLEDFRRFKKALSINGQFKTNLIRHEKDDRFDIDDKSRWVLGWDNLDKLKEFKKQYENVRQKRDFLQNKMKEIQEQLDSLQDKRDTLRDILKYESFEKIDWYRFAKAIEELKEEKEELLKSSDIIKTLQKRLQEIEIKRQNTQKELDEIIGKIGKLEEKIDSRELELNRTKLILANKSLENETKKRLDGLRVEVIGEQLTLNTIKTSQSRLRDTIQKEIDKFSKNTRELSAKISTLQSKFIGRFPVISKEFGHGVEYCEEFNKKLQELQKDNLPKWQKKFKQLLKEGTIRDVIMLQSLLEENANGIKNKIETINKSLYDIEYSDGTYIELLAQNSNIQDIKEFRQNLKQIVSGAIDEDNEYDEQKFLQIKTLIEKFNGREGYSEVDKKWRKLVIDVRNWFDFGAIEKYISDGSTKEYYAHSGGKSGGQKEKLAYTVLASSLAYQFGLEYDKIQSRSFRFVMIDEAFGRGSDESTRYALKLFEKLRLQLLVITPKQKINVIEPFVKSVHFVHNQDGMDSSLVSLSIEEYVKNRKK